VIFLGRNPRIEVKLISNGVLDWYWKPFFEILKSVHKIQKKKKIVKFHKKIKLKLNYDSAFKIMLPAMKNRFF